MRTAPTCHIPLHQPRHQCIATGHTLILVHRNSLCLHCNATSALEQPHHVRCPTGHSPPNSLPLSPSPPQRALARCSSSRRGALTVLHAKPTAPPRMRHGHPYTPMPPLELRSRRQRTMAPPPSPCAHARYLPRPSPHPLYPLSLSLYCTPPPPAAPCPHASLPQPTLSAYCASASLPLPLEPVLHASALRPLRQRRLAAAQLGQRVEQQLGGSGANTAHSLHVRGAEGAAAPP